MKKLQLPLFLIIALILVSFATFTNAQRKLPVRKISSLDSIGGKDAVYVMDEKLIEKPLQGIDPKNILQIEILQPIVNKQTSTGAGNKETVLITTKTYGKISYQKKLSKLSEGYNKLITANKGDNDFDYVINGSAYKAGRDRSTQILYDLKPVNIQSIKIDDDMGVCLDHSVTVRIKTKTN